MIEFCDDLQEGKHTAVRIYGGYICCQRAGTPNARYTPAAAYVDNSFMVLWRMLFQVVDEQTTGLPQFISM